MSFAGEFFTSLCCCIELIQSNTWTLAHSISFSRSGKCDAAIIITASHLPEDKNGIKFFSSKGGLDKKDIDDLIVLAQEEATQWYNTGIMPPSSGNAGVLCSERVSIIRLFTSVKATLCIDSSHLRA